MEYTENNRQWSYDWAIFRSHNDFPETACPADLEVVHDPRVFPPEVPLGLAPERVYEGMQIVSSSLEKEVDTQEKPAKVPLIRSFRWLWIVSILTVGAVISGVLGGTLGRRSSSTASKSFSQSTSTVVLSIFTTLTPKTTAAPSTNSSGSPTTAATPATKTEVPSTTVAATATLSGEVGRYHGPKRGIIYNTASLAAPFAQASAIGWGHDWFSSAGGLASNLNFVPMLWGSDVGSFASDAASAIKAGADSIMAMNEPDQPKQYGGSDITPGNAAQIYKTNIVPLAGTVKVGAPAVSNGNSSSPLLGVQWLNQFFEACSGSSCPIDFVPFHWYGWNGGTAQQQAEAFKDYIIKASVEVQQMSGVNEYWITEFSAMPLNDVQINADFMAIVLPWLDSDPAAANVARYSYFMVSDGLLVNGGSLTASGQAYISDS